VTDWVMIDSSDVFNDYVILHEYSHYLEEQISGFPAVPSLHDGCFARDVFGGTINSAEHAWMEGFDDYFAMMLASLQPPGRLTVTPGRRGSSYEHALLLLAGDAELEGQAIEERRLYYLGITRSEIRFSSRSGARLLLIGGQPFPESILMWWNFVARTPEEIIEARTAWEERQWFGEVKAYQGLPLSAPPLVKLARPNPAS
jgi:hypothetical protein